MDLHKTEQKIVLKLIHSPTATFNEIWNKEGESNKLSYHLHKLEEKNLVKKTEKGYKKIFKSFQQP